MATKYKSKAERKKIADNKRKKRLRKKQIADRDLVRQYSTKMADIPLGNWKWKVESIRHDQWSKYATKQDISATVESVTWNESGESSGLTGTLSIRRPDTTTSKFDFGDGHQVMLSVWWGGNWRELWRMRVWKPTETLPDNTAEFELADDGKLLAANIGDFEYKKDKKRNKPKGWKSHQIIRDLAKTYKIPLGRVPHGKADMTISLKKKSVMDVIKEVYKKEKEETGRRYIIRWSKGKLYILPLKRQPYLYSLEKQIRTATITKERSPSKFMTAAMVHASYPTGQGRKKKKAEFVVVDRALVKRYGYIQKSIELGEVKSHNDAVKKARWKMSRIKRAETLPTFTIEHEGIPFIRRGDGVRVIIKQFGIDDKHRRDVGSYKQKKEYKQRLSTVFVSSITHTIQGGDYTMTPEFVVDDPVAAYHDTLRAFIDKKKRDAKKKK